MSAKAIEAAFLAVMNANDRELSLPLTDWAGRNLLKRRINAAIAAYLAAEEAAGRVMVPVEATEEMGDAGVTLIYERGGAHNVWEVYAAMIAARPKDETPRADDGE